MIWNQNNMSERSPKVSVIIPTFNEQENIDSCLKTLFDQGFKQIEIIVVDDGSSDGTVSIVQKYPVKLIQQKHQGPGIARNKASKEANGEILVFIDADMTFSKNFIEDLTAPIREGKVMGTFSKEEYISNWESVWSRCWNYNQDWPKQKMIPDDYPDEGKDFRAILRSEFLRVGGFDNIGYTDTWSLSEKLGYPPIAAKRAVYYHANPSHLKEVFIQSKWSAKRNYKFGLLGKLIAIVRSSLPVSIVIGVIKSIKYKEPLFPIFKVIYDFGAFIGIGEMIFLGKLSK